MKSLFLFLYLFTIIVVCQKTIPLSKFQDLKKKNNLIISTTQIHKTQSQNTQSEDLLKKSQPKKKPSKWQFKESQLQILDLLKPLFGLRKKDQNRDQNGKVINQNMEKEIQQSNNTEKIVNKSTENEQLLYIWDQKMGDFEPEVTLTFDLSPGSSEVFFEEILKPTTIKGAFFISQLQKEEKIDFYIKSSNNTLIYSKERVTEAIFNIDLLEKGEYQFTFQNKRTKKTQTITFTLDVHDSEQEFLKMEDLDPLALKIERIAMAMKDNYYFDKITGQQFEGYLREIQNSNNKLFLFSFIEIVGLIFITIWQVYYLKRILGNQKLF
ncbi:unnamed protein product [Paramecium sonneborni]|uniref:GOLD domain-containing protein n=1 Tax=Paramecium sonneborni TaxID=65129 RepID=A0A8S1Q3G2_9CILI|nr:unnamed protein product [Paramecium sonneborni]